MALRIPRLRINKLWLLLAAALVLGLLAAWLSSAYLKSSEQRMAAELAQKAKGGPTVTVVVPVRDLDKGAVVSDKIMAAREVAADLVYPDAVTADQFDKVAGKPLINAVLKGRPLRLADVVESTAKDLSSVLENGQRALTFDIDETNSFAQMLRPGNYVDLYLIAQDPTAPPPSTQEIRELLPRVKVLATGQTVKGMQPPPSEEAPGGVPVQATYTNITVEVAPAQAAKIALAQQVGRIRAVLRNPEDEMSPGFSRLAATALFHEGQSASVEYIVGGKSGGSGTTAPISINMPNLSIPGLTAPPAGASPGATYSPGQSSALAGQPTLASSVPAVPTGAH